MTSYISNPWPHGNLFFCFRFRLQFDSDLADVGVWLRLRPMQPMMAMMAKYDDTPTERKTMHRRNFVNLTFVSLAGFSLAPEVIGQQTSIEPDLTALADGKVLNVLNCCLRGFKEGGKNGVRMNGDGLAYFTGIEFSNGAIEADLRGRNVEKESLIGLVFHGVDRKTYDAIYFRPFHFKTEYAGRRMPAVQYIAHPTYTWRKLRDEHPGKYEQAVDPDPGPDDWFHVRVLVESPKVSVFINESSQPCLVVTQLSDRKKGLVGLWGGGAVGGDLANLKIIPA
jgi:hypothetical protein